MLVNKVRDFNLFLHKKTLIDLYPIVGHELKNIDEDERFYYYTYYQIGPNISQKHRDLVLRIQSEWDGFLVRLLVWEFLAHFPICNRRRGQTLLFDMALYEERTASRSE